MGILFLALGSSAVPARAQGGATLARVEAAGVTYEEVKILSRSAATVTIRHRGGIAQLPWRQLSPELQTRLGFDPAAPEAEDPPIVAPAPRLAARSSERAGRSDSAIGRAVARFGSEVTLGSVDLRPRFRELDLGTKNQGHRPSCAVFAVVSALEFQNAARGESERLSEEYVIWATRRTLGLANGERRLVETGDEENDRDAGFSLAEVLAAVRAYGIPLQKEMPNTYGVGMEKIAEPSGALIASARDRARVTMVSVPGVNNAVRIANIMHVLNEGVPVVVALRWPHWRSVQAPLLSRQTPLTDRSHAVTLVGYHSNNGQREGLRFIFKNSWGIRWGTGGYGFVELGYLDQHLLEAVVLEVRPTEGGAERAATRE